MDLENTDKGILVNEDKNQTVKEKIMFGTICHLFKCGVQNVKMDELASQFGVSKKTLYVHFKNKEELISESVKYKQNELFTTLDKLIDESTDFIETSLKIGQLVADTLSKTPSSIMYDLQMQYPQIHEECNQYRRQHLETCYRRFVDIGKKQNIIRKDIPTDAIIHIYDSLTSSLFQNDKLKNLGFSMSELYHYMINIFMEGMLSKKGRNEFKKQMKSKLEQIENN